MCSETFKTPEESNPCAHACKGKTGHGTKTPHECASCGYQWLTAEWQGN